MRNYAKISPQFWIGSTGRKLRDAGPEATLVALYLLSNPHANMLGLYYLPQLYIAHETGLGIEGASKGLRRAIEAEFCDYDEASEVVFVCEMARFQIAERLEPKDKRCIGIQREYDALPNNLFLPNFYEKYVGAFHLKNRREGTSPLEEAPKALRSQEQEQEQEQEREQERAGGAVAPSTAKTKRACQMSEGFQPKESHRALAVELAVNLDAAFAKFCDHHSSKGSTFKDWDRALNTWLRNEQAFVRGNGRNHAAASQSKPGDFDPLKYTLEQLGMKEDDTTWPNGLPRSI